MCRLGSVVPRIIARTFTTSVSRVKRLSAAVTMVDCVETSRHPPQASEMRLNSASVQRRAAPMPRVSDSVSDMVLRVPKLTSFRISASIRSAETASMMS